MVGEIDKGSNTLSVSTPVLETISEGFSVISVSLTELALSTSLILLTCIVLLVFIEEELNFQPLGCLKILT